MTLSIIARCSSTGQFGICAATAMPAVGKLLTHAVARTGAIATQARINPYLGIDGMTLLGQRLSAVDVVALLRRSDPCIEDRQFAVVDLSGNTMAFTGANCPGWAGHESGDGFSVQGNRLARPEVVRAAAEAFGRTTGMELAVRLVEALEAGHAAGGDSKGEESATLYVMDTEEYPLWDIRVDLHPHPVAELRQLYQQFRSRLHPQVLAMPTRKNPAGESEGTDV